MREQAVKEYTYSRRYKFVFIWLSNVLLVLLTLSIVYWKPLIILANGFAWVVNYYFLANSFNKKLFVHYEGKFVYRNVFRRRLSFNIEDIERVELTTVRKGLMIKLKEGRGYVFLTPYWRNYKLLYRFVINRVDPAAVSDRLKMERAFGL